MLDVFQVNGTVSLYFFDKEVDKEVIYIGEEKQVEKKKLS